MYIGKQITILPKIPKRLIFFFAKRKKNHATLMVFFHEPKGYNRGTITTKGGSRPLQKKFMMMIKITSLMLGQYAAACSYCS